MFSIRPCSIKVVGLREKPRLRTLVLMICLVACGVGIAQELAITDARIIEGTGRTIEGGTIIVREGRIVSVGASEIAADGMTQIDAAGMTVLPGMIETHTHLLLADRGEIDS